MVVWKKYVGKKEAISIMDCRGIYDHVNKPTAGVALYHVSMYNEGLDDTRWVGTNMMLWAA